jgi:nucleoside-diphosphate-sugar epimerase
MNVFVTGATGYIGGSVAMRLLEHGHNVVGLTRDEGRAELLRQAGMTPVLGSLDDAAIISDHTARCDVTINTANSDHPGAVDAIIAALAGSNKRFIHTSGSSIVGTRAGGVKRNEVFDEYTPFEPSAFRAARVAINEKVLNSTSQGVHAVVIAPSLIYGHGRGVHRDSMQVPWMLDLAAKRGIACHVGPGENVWANVHIDDLVDLYMLALAGALAGAFYFAENGENSMKSVAQAIGTMMGQGADTRAMDPDEAADAWGEGPANDTMGSNSRVRATRARKELGWQPHRPSLLQEVSDGCYRDWTSA